ncbi:MAG: NAD(P)/FAD-dependent oxidoreductase [Bryobacterales bacterium]|nr:NAD(P)/FAD-dependent oxidoreductase [Bryobacterales bacterium]
MATLSEFDAIVIGAGPTGCVAAKLLARWGHRVALLSRRAPPVNVAESLPPSAATILQLAGAEAAVHHSAFSRCHGNVAWWGAGEPRRETYPEDSAGYHIRRAQFDDRLRGDVAELLFDAPVKEVRRVASEFEVRTADRTYRAPFLLDCSGRAGVVARDYRIRNDAQRTIGVAAIWTQGQAFPVETTYTLIEAYPDGWAWGIPLSLTEIYAGAILDSQQTDRLTGSGLDAMLAAEINKTHAFRELLRNAEPVEVASCGASTYDSRSYSDDGLFLVGDAASTVDPISSFGLKKGLTSAWLAAVCVHTSLIDSSRRHPAHQHYDVQTRQSHADLERNAGRHFAVIADRQPHPFWTVRAAQGKAFYDQSSLLNELARLRALPSISLERASCVRPGRRIRVSGNEIVWEEACVTDALPAGLEFACGVDLMLLARLADNSDQVASLHLLYNQAAEPVDLPNFLGALCLLLSSGVLRHRASEKG